MGYHQAGFEVVGVDSQPQPHYPFEFHRADAFVYPIEWWGEFDAIHASPPCQDFSAYGQARKTRVRGNLIPATRDLLVRWGGPWVIENVEGAPLRVSFRLCGSSFGREIRRHRLFESSFAVLAPPCDHSWQTPKWPASTNRAANSRRTIAVGQWNVPLADQQREMGIDWMDLGELSEAIPPVYTELIGRQLLSQLEEVA